MKLKNILKPLYYLPYEKKGLLRDLVVFFVSKLPISMKIRYRGYDLKLLNYDRSAHLIFLSYLINGSWEHESFEQEVISNFIEKSQDKDILFVDIGASYGMYSFLAAKHENVTKIVAIEAYEPVYTLLKFNMGVNYIHKASILNMVVSDKDGDKYKGNFFNNSEWNQFEKVNSINCDLKSITLESIIKKFKKPENNLIIIKMDVEGNEPLVFQGISSKLLCDENINIMLEFHVGVLERLEGQAFSFADYLLSIENTWAFIMDVGKKKLIPIQSKDIFFKRIEQMKSADFPYNLFNILLIKKQNIALFSDYIMSEL